MLGVVVVVVVVQFSATLEQVAARSLAGELTDFAAALPPGAQGCVFASDAAHYFRGRELGRGTILAIGVPGCRDVGSGVGAEAFLADSNTRRWLRSAPAHTSTWSGRVAGKQVEVLRAPVVSSGHVIGTFVAATDLAPFAADRSRVLRLSIAEAAIALLVGVASAWLLLRRLLRTVGRITTAAQEIEEGEIERRLGDQGTDDEVGRLATTFDSMLDRIETAMGSQRRLLSDVSHQLRTPLTVARGHLEVLQRTSLNDPLAVNETVDLVVDELDHMRALVERLLLLGRAMEPDFLAKQPIDLRSCLGDVYAAAQVLADRRWTLAPVPDVVVEADEPKLRGALLNLVDNAVKATVAGDDITLAAEIDGPSGDLILSVDDSGPGIPPADRGSALVRFSRPGATDGRGAGLGLAIVRAVAEAHGGSTAISTSALGGCRVAVRLPSSSVRRGGLEPALVGGE